MGTAHICVVMQRVVVFPYRRFFLDSRSLKMVPDRLSRNVGKKITTTRCAITQKSAVLMTSLSCPAIQSAADGDSIKRAVAEFPVGISSLSSTDGWPSGCLLCRNCITVADKQLDKTSATYQTGICWTLCRTKSLTPALEREVLEV
jgi:hypothetical protein